MRKELIHKLLGRVMITLMLCLTACQDDDFGLRCDTDCVFTVSATTKFSGVESRAIFDETNNKHVQINNYALLLFSKKATDGTLIFADDLGSDLSSPKTVPIPITEEFAGGTKYFAVLLGNATKDELAAEGVTLDSKLEVLYGATFSVNSTDNKPNPEDAENFTWSGYAEVSKDDTSIKFTLNPNVAKVTANITNNSGSNEPTHLVNVQVRNVASKIRYAQNALSKAGIFSSTDNSTGDMGFIDYVMDELDLSDGNTTTATISWYVPHNELYETTSSGTRDKRADANATYIEVSGVRSTDHLTTAYRIYPGITEEGTEYANLKNYYVKADYQYNLNITINDDGLTYSGDNNVSNKAGAVAKNLVKLPSNANCHMINPNFSRTADGYPVYELPIDRINECWGTDGQIPYSEMALQEGDNWTMDVIWQDISTQVITFCDKDGTGSSNTYSGTGLKPAYFKIVPSSVTDSHYGNILVGVRKTDSDDYLWSWHLWVTDYNPDIAEPFVPGTYTYLRESTGATGINGNVQHWNHTQSFYWGTTNFLSGAIWNSGGLYGNSWIMDRNLGAVKSKTWLNGIKTYGLYYQWGSKNPYPHASYRYQTGSSVPTSNAGAKGNNTLKGLYTINGTATYYIVDASNLSDLRKVQDVTKSPNVLYAVDNAQLYDDSYTGRNHIWASPKEISNKEKSLFDPCPPGWTVPVYDIVDFLTYSPGSYGLNKGSADEVAGWLGWYSESREQDFLNANYCTLIVNREYEDNATYGQKDFAYAALLYKDSSSTIKIYRTDFPIQGVLCEHDEGISDNKKVMMWFSEPSIQSGKEDLGDAIIICTNNDDTNGTAPTSSHFTGNTYREKLGKDKKQYLQEMDTEHVTYYDNVGFSDIWSGRISRVPYNKSRGQNVRCIQLPQKETLKYYNKD